MLFQDEQVILIIIAGTAFLLLLGFFMVGFLLMFQKKQNKNRLEKAELKASFKQELLKTRIEIQEQTLNDVSREMHDNITQVLSFVKLNLGMLGNTVDDTTKTKINDNRELISQTINDVRNLSKSLSFEHISAQGLVKTLESEAIRINKSGLIQMELSVDGDAYSLGEQAELVFFRIFQEALNNVLKHANAANFKIGLHYQPQMFNLTIQDDGVGFQPEKLTDKSGSGLRNITNRAALIGAQAVITSAPHKGCLITLSLDPLTNENYADGTHSNSPGG
jgi:signal transduction histidine kinase